MCSFKHSHWIPVAAKYFHASFPEITTDLIMLHPVHTKFILEDVIREAKTIPRKINQECSEHRAAVITLLRMSVRRKCTVIAVVINKSIQVLNGLNIKIRAGETVAFVGHSGCGKSTAVGLITRLYEAESGTVSQTRTSSFGCKTEVEE